MVTTKFSFPLVIVLCFLLSACGDEIIPTPKPRAFPRVDYPQKAYQSFDKDYCSFSIEHPVYSSIEQDTLFFDEQPDHPCWFDVFIPAFDCRLHCSYTPIGDEDKTFEALKNDAFDLVDWHNKRANYIDELLIDKGNNVTGIAFSIEGPAASPLQFFLTDKENHFFRGALYFNTRVRPDSLAPIYEFVKEDVFKLIETFEWEEGV